MCNCALLQESVREARLGTACKPETLRGLDDFEQRLRGMRQSVSARETLRELQAALKAILDGNPDASTQSSSASTSGVPLQHICSEPTLISPTAFPSQKDLPALPEILPASSQPQQARLTPIADLETLLGDSDFGGFGGFDLPSALAASSADNTVDNKKRKSADETEGKPSAIQTGLMEVLPESKKRRIEDEEGFEVESAVTPTEPEEGLGTTLMDAIATVEEGTGPDANEESAIRVGDGLEIDSNQNAAAIIRNSLAGSTSTKEGDNEPSNQGTGQNVLLAIPDESKKSSDEKASTKSGDAVNKNSTDQRKTGEEGNTTSKTGEAAGEKKKKIRKRKKKATKKKKTRNTNKQEETNTSNEDSDGGNLEVSAYFFEIN